MPSPADKPPGAAFAQRALRAARRRLAGDKPATKSAAPPVPVSADIVVHFAETPDRLYQLTPWLPVLDRLAEQHPVLLVARNSRTMNALASSTSLPVVCAPTSVDLQTLYDHGDFKVGIYVNNGLRNFQSLMNPRMLHVHVDHGESDKPSSFSNRVKGYDRVLVAGPAAAERYCSALIDFDEHKLVTVGRPPLDVEHPSTVPSSSRRTVLYAPTWQGESDSDNWTSLDRFGGSIVEQVLALPDVRLVYRPHPRVAASNDEDVAAAHVSVLRQIDAANASEPQAGHISSLTGDVDGLLEGCAALVGDVSSVSLDFLYLRPASPIFLTDRRDNRDLLIADSPLASGADIVDSSTIGTFGPLLADRLGDDARRDDRARARKHYFGDLRQGDSLPLFLAAVNELVVTRDHLLAAHGQLTSGDGDGRD